MPDDQPSSATPGEPPVLRDDLSAAAVLHDDAAGQPVASVGAGAATPNSPIDADLPHDAGNARATAEARLEAVVGNPAEPGHTSQ